jgi:hypothetical protein
MGSNRELNMTFTAYVLTATLILAAAVTVWLTDAARVLFRYRGRMLFTCPETRKSACVKVAGGDAARSALFGRPKIHLSDCSRWPERQDCGQECLSQLGANPESCLVWTKVCDWYHGRACVYCHKPFNEQHWHDHRPALMGLDRKTVQWNEIAAEKLPEIFETYRPVCWSCHIAETFRREYPGRFVDRPANRGPMGELLTAHEKDEAAGTFARSSTR